MAKVDFDDYANNYESLLENQLSFFNGERTYFSEYKIRILRTLCGDAVSSLLDFGAGIGLSLPHLEAYFPCAKIYATDLSKQSLALISNRFPNVHVVPDEAVGALRFDVILIVTVLHHVEPSLRQGLIERLAGMLNPGGKICIFEHNPYNPVTRRMVATCPFDSDAVLLPLKESRALLERDARLTTSHAGYALFFPDSLKRLRALEPALRWFPLGGQYYIMGRR